MRARIVWLVAVAALIVVVIVVSAAANGERDESVSYAPYNGGPQWHPHMKVICVQVQGAPGFPIEAAALAFSDYVDTIGRADCEDRPFVIEVVTVIEPEESWAGWWNSVRDDDGYVEGGTIRLNVAKAWQMEPGDWRVLLLHEFGHAFGLEHTFEVESVMNPTARMYARDGLTEADREMLAEIWDERR